MSTQPTPPTIPLPTIDAQMGEQQALDRLRLITDVAGAAGIALWEFDLKHNAFIWHSQRHESFGLDQVPLPDYYPALMSTVVEEDRHLLTDVPARAIAENLDTSSYTFRVRAKDGSIHHLRSVFRLRRNARGKFRYLMGVTIDVTQEVATSALLAERAEEKRRLVERLSMATESANIGSFEIDLVAQRFTWVESPIQALGLKTEDYGALADFSCHVVPEDRTMLGDAIRASLADGSLRFGFRYRFTPASGGIVHVQIYGRVFLSEAGKPLRAFGVSWDVTEEVLTQQRLQAQMREARELSERLGVATQAAGVTTFELDLTAARMLWCENPLAAWASVMPEDGDLRPFSVHMHPEDRHALGDAIKLAVQQGSDIIQYSYRLNTCADEWAHIRNYAKIYFNEQGRAMRALGAAWDITKDVIAKEKERQQVAHERDLLQRLSVVTQAAQILLWEFDLKTNSFYMLGEGLDVLGLKDELPQNVLPALKRIIVPEDQEIMENAARAAIAQGLADYTYIYRANGTDGQLHHMKNFARLLRSDGGTPYRILGVTWDHSAEVATAARLQAQVEAAREMSERLSLAIHAAGVSIWEMDLVETRFTWIENPLQASLVGIDQSRELLNFATHMHPEDRYVMTNAVKTAAHNGTDVVMYNLRVYQPDGKLAYIRVYGKLHFNAERRAVRMVGVSSDITQELAAAEKERERADQERALLQRLNVVIQAAQIMLWEFDPKTHSFHILGQGLNALGLQQLDPRYVLEALKQRVIAADRDVIESSAQAAIDQGLEEYSFTYRANGTDGQLHHMRNFARLLRNESGAPERILGVTWDHSAEVAAAARLQAQMEAAQEMSERLSIALQAAGVSIWEMDLVDPRFTWIENTLPAVKPALDDGRRLLTFSAHMHADDRDLMTDAIKVAVRDGTDVIDYRVRIRQPGGGMANVRVYGKLYFNAARRAVRMIGVSSDITKDVAAAEQERARAEQERALLQRLNVVIQASQIMLWEFDVKNNCFHILGEGLKALGMEQPAPAYVLETLKKRVIPEDREIIESSALEAIKQGLSEYNFMYRALGTDGQVHHMKNFARPLRSTSGRVYRIIGVTWDHTQEVAAAAHLQAQMEEARALSERLTLATQVAGVAMWEIDLVEARFLWIENAFPAIQTALAESLDLRTYTAHLHPDDRNAMVKEIKIAAQAGHDIIRYNYRIRTSNGEIAHIRNYAKLYFNAERRAVRIVGVATDITKEVAAVALEHQRAEQERALLQRLSLVVQAAQIMLWEFDHATNSFQLLGEGLNVLGLSQHTPSDVFGPLQQIIVPEDRDVMANAAKDAIQKGLVDYTFIYRALGTDAQVHHLKNFARLLRDDSGRPYRSIGATWDYSEDVAAGARLQAQMEAARALTERLSLAIQGAGISIWELDLVSQRFLWLENPLSAPSAARGPGGGVEELTKHVHPEDRNVLSKAIKAAVVEGTDVTHYSYRICKPDGEVAHIRNYAKLFFNEKKRAVRMLGVSSDITKEMVAEAKERQQAEQERALLVRFNLTTQAAGISTWEFDLKLNHFQVLGVLPVVDVLGMNSVPQERQLEHLKSVLVPENKDVLESSVRGALEQGLDEFSFRYRAIGTDGKVHHMKNHARILRGESGKPRLLVGVTFDYSEEVAATERLAAEVRRAQELKERLAVATLAAGISPWEIDLVGGKFLWVENPLKALSHLFKRGTLLSTFRDRIHPEDRDVFRNAAASVAKQGGDIATYRYRAFGTDGQLVHVQCYAKLFFDASNRPIRALGVSWDVTKEVVAADQLRLQAERLVDVEQRLERASISSSEGHWEAQLRTGQLWCSSSFHTLLGYIDGELEPRSSEFERLVHADDVQAYRNALRSHLEENKPYELEVRMLTASGEYRWIHLRGMADRDEDGVATLLAGSIQDIHQQKLVEDALKLAQLRFQRAIIGTQDGLWELDIAADQFWCSPRLAMLLGYPATQLEDNNLLRQLVHADDAPQVLAATQAHYRDNAPFDIEIRLQTRTDGYRWFRARATAERNSDGRALRLSGSLQDVTEARAARVQLMQATAAAEAANRAKSDFLANVSHEIRTPMNGIVGMAGLLLDTTLDPSQRDYAHTIRNSADSLLLVINDILDLSQIDTGRLELAKVDFDLRALVQDVAAALGYQAAAKSLQLTVEIDAAVRDRIHGDPKRLRQCLMNLVGNAIKFTATGGVGIAVRSLQDRAQELTSFQVIDTGIGIAPEVLPRLFQPFVQADTSSTRSFGGTGLGLSIVRRLVELMGGQVNVVSTPGKGSAFSFTVTLDAAKAPAAIAPPPPARTEQQLNGRVLLVEDNPVNQKVASRVLQRLGLQVDVADNGQVGVERFAQGIYDIVLMDVQMPVMDGLTAAAKIRELESVEALRRTPICALTANALQADQERCAAAGMDAFLTKPLDVDRLRAVLQQFAVGTERAPPAVIAETKAPSNAEPPVDLARFNSVTAGDVEFARELIELFNVSAAEQLQEAGSAFGAKDRGQLARIAHKLKGACANIHADVLRGLAAELELNAGTLEDAAVQVLLARLAEELRRTREFLSSLGAVETGDAKARRA